MALFSPTSSLHLLAALVTVACGVAVGEERADPRTLVEQLRSNDYDTRRAAAEKLAVLGETARTVLAQAAAGDDVEVRQTATALLKKLDTASIRLMAFDRDGKPAVGAEADVRVYVMSSGFIASGANEPRTESISVQADGTGRLAGLTPKRLNLQFTWKKWTSVRDASSLAWPWGAQQFGPAGYSSPSLGVQLERGENPMLVALARNGTVVVRVRDTAGKPLKDARAQLYAGRNFQQDLLDLQLACAESWGRGAAQAVATDESGEAKVEAAEGVHQCVIRMDGYVPAVTSPLRVHEGESLELPAIALVKKAGGKLSVTLHNADGTPLKKTRVTTVLDCLYAGPKGAELRREARRLRAQLAMHRSPEMVETDDAGQLVIEDLAPGTYSLTAARQGAPPWQVGEVTVTAGQTTVVPAQKPAAVGSIKGKVIGVDGKGMQYISVSAVAQQDSGSDDGGGAFTDSFLVQRRFGMGSSQTQADGAYEVGNLPTGKYTVSLNTAWGQPMLIYGVEVTAGKASSAPDAALTAPGPTSTRRIKGTVLLPDGQP
ncbi:MAG: hypothetical protein NTW87_32070, partial [Planctomycetota bacterium]|nr:hypothetical protein [Planctomycetota bacterium]